MENEVSRRALRHHMSHDSSLETIRAEGDVDAQSGEMMQREGKYNWTPGHRLTSKRENEEKRCQLSPSGVRVVFKQDANVLNPASNDMKWKRKKSLEGIERRRNHWKVENRFWMRSRQWFWGFSRRPTTPVWLKTTSIRYFLIAYGTSFKWHFTDSSSTTHLIEFFFGMKLIKREKRKALNTRSRCAHNNERILRCNRNRRCLEQNGNWKNIFLFSLLTIDKIVVHW